MTTETRKMSRGAFIANCVATVVFFPVLILGLAGDWRWLAGWIFSLWMAAMILFNLVYLYTKDPALLAERTKAPGSGKQKPSDKYLGIGIFALAVVWLVIQPLDAMRFGWSPPFPLWLKVIGALALIPSFYLIERTTIENTFLSTRIRIQDERKQHVISTGVYGFVRHPLYLGCLLMMWGTPFLLGSVCGLILTLVGSIALIARIIGEERLLVAELEGYDDYRRKVRFRLIPLVW